MTLRQYLLRHMGCTFYTNNRHMDAQGITNWYSAYLDCQVEESGCAVYWPATERMERRLAFVVTQDEEVAS